MYASKTPLILRLDVTGQPVRWIPWRDAVVLDSRAKIAWSTGDTMFTFRGGTNRLSGLQSSVTVNSIIAVKGVMRDSVSGNLVPPLSNRELFLRDGHLCMYCGASYPAHMLTRDHLRPLSRGGKDCWSNVVTSCKSCNHAKGARTLDEADMSLLAVPFVPNRAEFLVLSNRRILADQMEFLVKRFRKGSRLHAPN